MVKTEQLELRVKKVKQEPLDQKVIKVNKVFKDVMVKMEQTDKMDVTEKIS